MPDSPPTPAADLDVGVIYTHERQYIEPLLASLSRSGDDLNLRLILVDNASSEGVEPWRGYVSQTTVLKNGERLGYAANLNRILEAATAPLVLLLNTDMYFEPAEQCLSKLVGFMRQQPDCGLAGCRLYHPDGSYAYPARQFQSLRVIAARRAGLSRVMARTLRDYLYEDRSRYDSFDCDWLSGCLMLLRRQAALEVGPFDSGFAKYFEDVDMCLRMARGGWRVMFHGGAYAYHCEQRASKSLWSRDALHHLRSYLRWLGKWGPFPQRQTGERPGPAKAA